MHQNNIVKVCKKHGELTIEQCNIEHRYLSSGTKIYYRCHTCKVEKTHRYYAKNKDAILARARVENLSEERKAKMEARVRKYRETDKFKNYRKEYRAKNLELLRQKARDKYRRTYHLIKEQIQARRRELRNLNKEEINAKRRAKYIPKLKAPRRKKSLTPHEYYLLAKAKCPDLHKIRNRKRIDNLGDAYIRQLLKLDKSIKAKDVPAPLIELKRNIVKIRRILRNENK